MALGLALRLRQRPFRTFGSVIEDFFRLLLRTGPRFDSSKSTDTFHCFRSNSFFSIKDLFYMAHGATALDVVLQESNRIPELPGRLLALHSIRMVRFRAAPEPVGLSDEVSNLLFTLFFSSIISNRGYCRAVARYW